MKPDYSLGADRRYVGETQVWDIFELAAIVHRANNETGMTIAELAQEISKLPIEKLDTFLVELAKAKRHE